VFHNEVHGKIDYIDKQKRSIGITGYDEHY